LKHVVFLFALLAACSSQADNDQPNEAGHDPLGTGARLRDVQNPASPLYAPNKNVTVSSVVVTAVDAFDETSNGKSIGTIFVEDVDKAGPFAGVSMYSPTYLPGNLRLAPGDVIDMVGEYTEQTTIGTTVTFPSGSFLPQMNKPQVTQAFEVSVPQPTVIQLSDLDSFTTGRQWIGMLVTISDVTVLGAPTNNGGRVAAIIDNVANGPEINNELFDLQAWNGSNTQSSFPAGTHFKSVTGIVDFFFNLFICPRSMADLQQ
jgi:hypothetical protein